MISRFLTDLPVKDTPVGEDLILLEDIIGSGTKTTALSSIKTYLGITTPSGETFIGINGNVYVGNTTGNLNLSGNNINIISGSTFNINNGTGRTLNINTGAGAVTTTIGRNQASNNIVLNSTSITAPNLATASSTSTLMTRSLGDIRYGNIVDQFLSINGSTINSTSFSTVLAVALEASSTYEITLLFATSINTEDAALMGTKIAFSYSGTTSRILIHESALSDTDTKHSYYVGTTVPNNETFVATTNTGSNMSFLRHGVVITSTAGNLNLDVALYNPTPGEVGSTTPLAGSYLIARKIG